MIVMQFYKFTKKNHCIVHLKNGNFMQVICSSLKLLEERFIQFQSTMLSGRGQRPHEKGG